MARTRTNISIDREVTDKLAVIAREEGYSLSRKLEMLAREVVRTYETARGEIKVDKPNE